MSTHRIVMSVCIAAGVAAFASPTEAGWGRYRVSTYYGTASVPVVRETVVVRGAYRPIFLTPAPVVVAAAPVTAYYAAPSTADYGAPVTIYYGAPAVYIPTTRRAVRATYYAPAPQTYFYAPAPAAYYYHGYPQGTVILP